MPTASLLTECAEWNSDSMQPTDTHNGLVVDKTLHYSISELTPLIDWSYFFHAWQIPNRLVGSEEAQRLLTDAKAMLEELSDTYNVNAVYMLFDANSDSDDILLGNHRLPMLRQQTIGQDGFCRCLSDYIRPLSHDKKDKAAIFATATDAEMESLYPEDDYRHLLAQTLADRLAEAAAERLNKDESDIFGTGIRPAVGYPCMPDISLNFLLDSIADFSRIGITLTEHGMMRPHAAVSGLLIRHPEARYFAMGKITEEQVQDYALRRGMKAEEVRKNLSMYNV